MRVVIADDRLPVREGIASLLRRAGFDVVAEASTADDRLAAVAQHAPAVAVIDVRMPPTFTEEGIHAARRSARRPEIGIVILSQHVQVGIALRVLAEQPARRGHLPKDRVADIEDFAATLRHVAAGGSALDPKVVSGLPAGERTRTAASSPCSPTARRTARGAGRDAPAPAAARPRARWPCRSDLRVRAAVRRPRRRHGSGGGQPRRGRLVIVCGLLAWCSRSGSSGRSSRARHGRARARAPARAGLEATRRAARERAAIPRSSRSSGSGASTRASTRPGAP